MTGASEVSQIFLLVTLKISYISFRDRERVIGVTAKNEEFSFPKNTIFGFKKFLGRRYERNYHTERVPFDTVRTENGGVGIQVRCLGQQDQVIAPEQLTAMLFRKLKKLARSSTQTRALQACVLSVPSYFTDAQRRALLNAAFIAELLPQTLLNDTTAAALTYGVNAQGLPEPNAPPRNVVIIDCGVSAIQVCVAAFNKGKLKVLSSNAHNGLGGQEFDAALSRHLWETFTPNDSTEPHIIDKIRNNRRGFCMQLLAEADMLKKRMSATTSDVPIHIDCLMGEEIMNDATICRATFEKICSRLFNELEVFLQKCLLDSKLGVDEIYSVELVGGASRIPAIKSLIKKVFRKTPSTTMNANEAVAHGCALQAAILSSSSYKKVLGYQVTDIQPYKINILWEQSLGKIGDSELFPKGYPFPCVQEMTFEIEKPPTEIGPLTFSIVYGENVPYSSSEIGKFVLNLKHEECKPSHKFKIMVILTRDGTVQIDNAMDVEDINFDPTDQMDSSDHNSSVQAVKNSHETVRSLMFEASYFELTRSELKLKIIEEDRMIAKDKFEKERQDIRNTLEQTLNDMLEDNLINGRKLFDEAGRQKVYQYLIGLKEWLYEKGMDAQTGFYQKKLMQLREKIEQTKLRKAWLDIETTIKAAEDFIYMYYSKDAKYDHIDEKEVENVQNYIEDCETWLKKHWQHVVSPHVDVSNSVRLSQCKREDTDLNL